MTDVAPVPTPDEQITGLQLQVKSLQLTVTQLQAEAAQHELAYMQAQMLFFNERGPKLQAIIEQGRLALAPKPNAPKEP